MIKKFWYEKYANFVVTLVGLIALLYLVLLYMTSHALGMIYNADIISIPYLYQDLFFRNGNLSQWIFPPTMCFFPDMAVYFLLAAIVGNLKMAIVLFAVYQLLFYFFLIILIGKKVIKKHASSLFILSVFLTFFLYSSGYLQQNIFYAPTVSGHFGAALMFLLCTLIIINSITSNNRLNYVFLGLICFWTVFSDMLFITQFSVTALAVLFILRLLSDKEKTDIYSMNMWIIGITSVMGYIFYHNAKKIFHINIGHDGPVVKRYHIHDLILATKTIIAKLTLFYQNNAILLLALFIFIGITAVYLVVLFRRHKHQKISNEEAPFLFTILMLFMSVLTGYCSLIFLDNNLISPDESLRHYQPFVLFPVFLGIPLYIARFSTLAEMTTKYYKTIVVSLLVCAFIFVPTGSLSNLINFYPPEVACIDQYAAEYQLKNGVGQYWDTKTYAFLSKEKVNIATIMLHTELNVNKDSNKLIPALWYTTLNAYLNKDFNFALVEKDPNVVPTAADIIKAYGQPLKILQCANTSMSIYVYKKGVINSTWTKADLTL